MFSMYARLYYLLFRAHRRLLSLGNSSSTGHASGSGSGSAGQQNIGSGYGPAVPVQHTRKLKRVRPSHSLPICTYADGTQLARLMLLYPLAYAVVWSLPTSIRIYQAASGRPAPWQLQTVDKACIVLQGLVDAVIYGATESSLGSWRNLLFPGRFPASVGHAGYGDLSGNGSAGAGKRRWSSAAAAAMRAGGDKQPLGEVMESRLSTTTTGESDGLARSGSEDGGGRKLGDATGQIELGELTDAATCNIRKTVKIEVSVSGGGRQGPQRPGNAYFPEGESQVSFLRM